MVRALLLTLVLSGVTLAAPAAARVCDYRPTEVLRSGAVTGAVTGAIGTATDLALKADGIFTLTNTVTGASLMGTGAAGGTLAQITGAAGALGSAAAGALAAPGAAVAGAVAVVGLGAYEGLCFFSDDRVTDYGEVLAVMEAIAVSADPAFFRVEPGPQGKDEAVVILGDGTGAETGYPVRRLYISNGVLMHRNWGVNTALGNVGFATLADGDR
jgi:hypothetical protein